MQASELSAINFTEPKYHGERQKYQLSLLVIRIGLLKSVPFLVLLCEAVNENCPSLFAAVSKRNLVLVEFSKSIYNGFAL